MFKRRRRGAFFIFLAVMGILIMAVIVVERRLAETIVAMAQARAVQTAVSEVNLAVRSHLAAAGVDYQDLIELHKDDQGRVVMMQANTVRINELAAGFALAAEKNLREMDRDSFSIPLGQVTGNRLLAAWGPRIPVRILPVGAVRVNMSDRFESAGINQTRHRIYLDLDTDLRVVVPWHEKNVQVTTRVPLVENIVVGGVPSTYVGPGAGLLGLGLYGTPPPGSGS
ncbi:MAG: sporulation protein YunB [Thermoanaerobacterales bacterium]|nr:sporulation protein YunB [Bacillota bacterium]MDI6906824.1 sporulation protein YunB [Thermoanaerobacterales bacterium]